MRCILLVVSLSFCLYSSATASGPNTATLPHISPKSQHPIESRVREFLAERDGAVVKAWIFFTDKNVFSQNDFDQLAASVQVPDKTMTRRSKVGLEHIVFADLPVVESYVNQISDLGGKLRRTSKWLNAASFEIPLRRLEAVAKLPFVATIKPVARSVRPDEPEEALQSPDTPPIGLSSTTLDYGPSEYQLRQIYVPEVHAKGYDGTGVTLAIFDTGFRKSHEAFAVHFEEGRVLGEYDFVYNDGNTANEPWELSFVQSHGTNCWSIAAGHVDGRLYGPAYKANFLLAKTEDKLSETIVEEDNWIAALEWADSAGADVISSSLGYLDWYTYEDFDGETAPITIAANTASDLGILVCNAIGNEGPAEGTLIAPADAFDILAVGGVDVFGNLALFSSRGPTYDGRIKPEVCARGVSTYFATSTSDISYGSGNGTSYATPLVAGAACLLIQAYPTFTPAMIRQALMETACQADAPDNNYGWGVIDACAALGWPAGFKADITSTDAPIDVHFTCTSPLTIYDWRWSFGDGDSAFVENPSHEYELPGVYSVSLTVETDYGTITNEKADYILAYGDTLTFPFDSALAGEHLVLPVNITNSQPLNVLTIPLRFKGSLDLRLDSISLGDRTSYFELKQWLLWDPANETYAYRITADAGGGSPPLPVGSGEVLKLHATIDQSQVGNLGTMVDTANGNFPLTLVSPLASYAPKVTTGLVLSKQIIRGDANYSQRVDIEDPLFIIDYSLNGGPAPITIQSADANADLSVDIDDVVYLIDCMFTGGPPPPTP